MEEIKNFLTKGIAGACQNIVIAALILIVGLWLVKLISRSMKKWRLFEKIEPAARNYLQNAIAIILRAVVIISAAAYLGVPMASVAAVLGSAGLALGLALQGGLSNIAGGIMLLLTHPFHIGDYVVIGDRDGTVESIGIYYTVIVTPDNRKVVIPNGTVTNSVITDYTAKGTRRLDIDFSVAYDSNADEVRQILEDAAKENEYVLTEPKPEVFMASHADNAIVFKLRVWTDTDGYWNANFSLIETVKKEFDKAGIEIPYPQMDVHIR